MCIGQLQAVQCLRLADADAAQLQQLKDQQVQLKDQLAQLKEQRVQLREHLVTLGINRVRSVASMIQAACWTGSLSSTFIYKETPEKRELWEHCTTSVKGAHSWNTRRPFPRYNFEAIRDKVLNNRVKEYREQQQSQTD
ncbi:hypothetical protein WJX72_003670 [[Myrmecia] bisecta]|uniref:Uncharacterized protein n=1 Tax=[Myrmecia] bisecta TaxID=41462 RepID=A0AAW1R5L0_9CHLO